MTKLKERQAELVKAIEEMQDLVRKNESDASNASKSLNAMQVTNERTNERLPARPPLLYPTPHAPLCLPHLLYLLPLVLTTTLTAPTTPYSNYHSCSKYDLYTTYHTLLTTP